MNEIEQKMDGDYVSINFVMLPENLITELEQQFPEADVLSSSAFSGEEIVSIIIENTEPALLLIGAVFLSWKRRHIEVTVKIGDISCTIKALKGADVRETAREVSRMIKDAKQ